MHLLLYYHYYYSLYLFGTKQNISWLSKTCFSTCQSLENNFEKKNDEKIRTSREEAVNDFKLVIQSSPAADWTRFSSLYMCSRDVEAYGVTSVSFLMNPHRFTNVFWDLNVDDSAEKYLIVNSFCCI